MNHKIRVVDFKFVRDFKRAIQKLDMAEPGTYAAIVVDPYLGGNGQANAFVKWIRQKFDYPIIALGSDDRWRRELFHAGCTHQCNAESLETELKSALHLNARSA